MSTSAIAERVRSLRGKTPRRVIAERSGLHLREIAKIERGEVKHPRADTLIALAGAFGVPVGELLEQPASEPDAGAAEVVHRRSRRTRR